MQSSDEVIAAAVARATGAPLAAKTRITTGYSNEVYAATTADGERVIVKIHHPFLSDAPYFLEERWALSRCAEAGVPAPCPLLVDQVTDAARGGRRLSILVETHLDGQPLQELRASGALQSEDARAVLIEAGALLARLHSVGLDGFGRIDATGRGRHATWSDYLLRDALADLLAAAKRVEFDPKEVAEAHELLQTHRPLWDGLAPRLLHGDLDPHHIMVSRTRAGDHRVSGFIDFEFPESGDPAADFAYWGLGEWFPTAWILDGYHAETALDPQDSTFTLRLQLHRVRHGLIALRWHGTRENPPLDFLELVRASLSRDLRELQGAKRTQPAR